MMRPFCLGVFPEYSFWVADHNAPLGFLHHKQSSVRYCPTRSFIKIMSVAVAEARVPHPLTQGSTLSWVVLDPALENVPQLMQGIEDQYSVLLLDAHRDGVAQITQWLQSAQVRPTTLHLVAHGAPGTIRLGSAELSLDTLMHYAAHLAEWKVDSLVLHSCQVAVGDAGEAFLQKLHGLTQAAIAASTQKIGNGNWDLDVAIGAVENANPFTENLKATYTGVFTTLTRLYTVTSDNENNARTGQPDDDFGKDIRVGANFVLDKRFNPPVKREGQPIEFNIFTDLPQSTGNAFLLLSIFDIDVPDEVNRLSFNDINIGILEGKPDLEFKSVFQIPSDLIVNPTASGPGKNFVQIDVDIINSGAANNPPTNAWEAEILKAELLINYILGESLGNAYLFSKATDQPIYQPGGAVTFTADIDTTLANQTVTIEAVVRNPQGQAVIFDQRPGSRAVQLTGDSKTDAFVWDFTLPADAPLGTWEVDFVVFDASTGDFQLLDRQTFRVGNEAPDPCGVPGPPSVFQFTQYVKFKEVVEGISYRGPLAQFEERLYLTLNPDVQAAVAAGFYASGQQHFELEGRREGRELLPLNLEINGLRMAALFDETFYLAQNPDVLGGVLGGSFVYGFDHFVKFGLYEGRNPSYYYDEATYLATYADVKAAVDAKLIGSGLEHFIRFGHLENRSPSTLFNAGDYLTANPDVQAAVASGVFQSAFDHYIEVGASEGRINTLLFENAFYLTANPDVKAAVEAGAIPSGYDHYLRSGQLEGRDPGPLFDESAYLQCNPDVAGAIAQRDPFVSGMEHYFEAGRQEGRDSFLVNPPVGSM